MSIAPFIVQLRLRRTLIVLVVANVEFHHFLRGLSLLRRAAALVLLLLRRRLLLLVLILEGRLLLLLFVLGLVLLLMGRDVGTGSGRTGLEACAAVFVEIYRTSLKFDVFLDNWHYWVHRGR